MAVKRSKKAKTTVAVEQPAQPLAAEVAVPKWRMEGEGEDKLDPQEEKILDWILKGVVAFILGWLALSILMVIGGYFGMWK